MYIEEMNSMADVTFPSVPQVMSLLVYDDSSRAKEGAAPVSGYPVICITVSRTLAKCKIIVFKNYRKIIIKKNYRP